jgi:hypothetical protein
MFAYFIRANFEVLEKLKSVIVLAKSDKGVEE